MSNGIRLNVLALGVAMGVVGAIMLFLTGIAAMNGFVDAQLITMMATFYKGFAATLLGSVIGAVWGFVLWFISGVIIASVYNRF